ncbi:chemotaxis protein CheB [Paraburkholderia lycopersici]|uniref:protein-glutamate methylesterase n=1 Tax=Paraburkholderia lycopersici TaxID=416944 RepID=A0A1G7CZ12_9BURK|nr:chemotaxis protein CheB [Paraburkholderia lycopersici]SDE43886.1 two-component system, chemotaxis family, response regulator CheB [Paraburkholderia lycopersici]
MTCKDFIAIGASWGGVDALRTLVAGFPDDLPATIAIVQHVGAHGSILPSLLSTADPLLAVHAGDGEKFQRGRIYVAPPDFHLLVDGECLRLSHGPKENFARPAIDPLLRSVASTLGARSIGVVLTGMLQDGAAGLSAIRASGGTTIVQDPDDAFASDMPRHAAPYADYVLPLARLSAWLVELTGGADCVRSGAP